MSYTLNIEPNIVKEAESCAMRNGTTIDAMIRACLLVFVAQGTMGNGNVDGPRLCQSQLQQKQALQIGLMKDEIKLPDNFDEVFDSLDHEVASMFNVSLA